METFGTITGRLAPIPAANVDTDVIMPKAFLKGIDRSGLALGLFHDLRFDETGAPRPGFALNLYHAGEVRFLVVGPNFGCGSSREHAVWGFLEYGVRAIIGTSFGAIFADNAANNGLLLITLDPIAVAALMGEAEAGLGVITVDLVQNRVEAGPASTAFAIDPMVRRMMMTGSDRIEETLRVLEQIRAFQRDYLADHPWLADEPAS